MCHITSFVTAAIVACPGVSPRDCRACSKLGNGSLLPDPLTSAFQPAREAAPSFVPTPRSSCAGPGRSLLP
eukprot:COSAG01_NODE_7816_length_3045_cov_6.803802_2_plen_71_part_00